MPQQAERPNERDLDDLRARIAADPNLAREIAALAGLLETGGRSSWPGDAADGTDRLDSEQSGVTAP